MLQQPPHAPATAPTLTTTLCVGEVSSYIEEVGVATCVRLVMSSGHSELAMTIEQLLVTLRPALCTTTIGSFSIHCSISLASYMVDIYTLCSSQHSSVGHMTRGSSKQTMNEFKTRDELNPHAHWLLMPCVRLLVMSSVFISASCSVYTLQFVIPKLNVQVCGM